MAFVHSIWTKNGKTAMNLARSNHKYNFIYVPDSIVKPDEFCYSHDVCAGGIHFFVDLQSALSYY